MTYIFNFKDLISDWHPIYGVSSGSIVNNPQMEVILEIPDHGKIKRLFIDEKEVSDTGRASYQFRNFNDPWTLCGDDRSKETFLYWRGRLDLKQGDNDFSPLVRFENGKWVGVGVDWRCLTLFAGVEQARQYAETPGRSFNSYGVDDPAEFEAFRAKCEAGMTTKLNRIIDKAVAEGKLN